jgi:transposase
MSLIRDEFEGVLATDFWQAYNIVDQLKQKCWAHLLRELKQVEEDGKDQGDWADFAKKLRRIFADGVRLVARRHELDPEKYTDLTIRLQGRLIDLAVADYENTDARRLAKRLNRERDGLLTFVEKEGIEPTNNRAERDLRPAVIMRKISQGNKTDDGARAQARMMSIFRTLKMRGYDPLETITDALKTKVKTGVLPALPKAKKP